MDKVCILGAGSWGTAQAILLAKNKNRVALWGRAEDGVGLIAQRRENSLFLPGVNIPEEVTVTDDMRAALQDSGLLVLAVPSQSIREVLNKVKEYLPPDICLVNTAKGLEISTGMRLSQVAEEVLGQSIMERYAVLSGPSHAEEVAREVPTAVTVASICKRTACLVQDHYMSPAFRVYTNPDLAGVELGGALKNIIALSTGVSYGLGFGDNTMAALMTRGLTEMIRMGVALGGDPRTFGGLSGMGDLVVTCGSRHSRNRRAGELIGRGVSLEDTLQSIGMVVEGVHACRVVHRIASEMNIDMPITRSCYQTLYEQKEPREAVLNLMQRQKRHETEEMAKGFIP